MTIATDNVLQVKQYMMHIKKPWSDYSPRYPLRVLFRPFTAHNNNREVFSLSSKCAGTFGTDEERVDPGEHRV